MFLWLPLHELIFSGSQKSLVTGSILPTILFTENQNDNDMVDMVLPGQARVNNQPDHIGFLDVRDGTGLKMDV